MERLDVCSGGGGLSCLGAFPADIYSQRGDPDVEGFMKTATLTLLIQFAGLLHLGLIAAGLTMPRAVNLRTHLAPLPNFIRQLFWVYYSFIGLCLISFGAIR